jgi:2-methylcitrate dehydratase PrpD
MHRIIDGVKDLLAKHKLHFDDIDLIEVHTPPYLSRLVHYPEPANADEAMFSLEHNLAAVLLGEDLFFDTLSKEKIQDSRFKEARGKIKTIPDPDREKDLIMLTGVDKVDVKLKNGKEYQIICEKAKTDPPNYMSENQVKDMFNNCAALAGFLSEKNLDHVADLVFNLEKVNDVTELMSYLTFGIFRTED